MMSLRGSKKNWIRNLRRYPTTSGMEMARSEQPIFLRILLSNITIYSDDLLVLRKGITGILRGLITLFPLKGFIDP